MNVKPNHIKPVFAPETEFQVQALTILSEDPTAEAMVPTETLDLSAEIEFSFLAHYFVFGTERLVPLTPSRTLLL